MLYFGHSLIDAGGNSVVQISAIDDIGKIPGFLTLKGGYLLGIARYYRAIPNRYPPLVDEMWQIHASDFPQ